MFKKKCKNCEKDISKNYKYCPNCGFSTKKQEDHGMFGRSDLDSSFEEMNFPRGFNMLFNSLMKNLDKQFKNIDQDMGDNIETKKPNLKKGGISISI